MKNLKLFSAISALLISSIPMVNASSEGSGGFEESTYRRPSSVAFETNPHSYNVNVHSNSGRTAIFNYNGQLIRVEGDGSMFVSADGSNWMPVSVPMGSVVQPAPNPRRAVAPAMPISVAAPSRQRAAAPRPAVASTASTLSSASRTTRSALPAAPTAGYYPGISSTKEGKNAIIHIRRMDASPFLRVDDVCEMLKRFAARHRSLHWVGRSLYEEVQRVVGDSPKDQIKYLIGKVEGLPREIRETADCEEVLNVLNDIWFLITRSSPLKNDAWRYVCRMFKG